ncbi:MAG TPA: DoxX family protein [Mucilaginibacter sp.]|jgi:putative oxidoreductase|nr:DoxX family protein [Mucilaginibacter sp.]
MLKKYQQLAPLALRLIIGYGSMVHGWAKLSRGVGGFEKLLLFFHVPFPHTMAWVVPSTELICGFAILIGLFIRITAIPMIFVMLTAIFTVHLKYGFSAVKTIGLSENGPLFGPPGYEVDLLYIAGLIALIIMGSGALSADALIKVRRDAVPEIN